jgi:DNA helicase-2/ATP-dependent DNA helicase PcrA
MTSDEGQVMRIRLGRRGGSPRHRRGDRAGQRAGTSLNEMAILVRASFQMREFEDRFVTLGLPYRVIGGPRFYERQEIRDALAYLPRHHAARRRSRVRAHRQHAQARPRRCGRAQGQRRGPRRGIPSARRRPRLVLTEELPQAAQVADDLLRVRPLARQVSTTLPHTEVAEIILDESGYTEMWQHDKARRSAGRLENLKELVRSMEEFETMPASSNTSRWSWTWTAASTSAVTIMTLHAAKGLEFDTVFLPGWEEGLFPHQRALDEGGRAGLEEERRLAYVGITRAKRHCQSGSSSNRRIHGLWQSSLPSRFLDELPAGAGASAHPAIQAAPMAPRASTRPNLSPATTTRPAGNAPRPTRPTPPATTGAPAPATRRTHCLR